MGIPRSIPAEVFRQVLRSAAERDSMDSPTFVQTMREEAALLGWAQLDEKDPKSWVQLLELDKEGNTP